MIRLLNDCTDLTHEYALAFLHVASVLYIITNCIMRGTHSFLLYYVLIHACCAISTLRM